MKTENDLKISLRIVVFVNNVIVFHIYLVVVLIPIQIWTKTSK